ncbi:DUF6244 family protein [Micromonospora sp. WMMC250]|uniref:DUF6244 family protein n=1 Tax=Micromonospora sp. WMMC250 TaxID=3014781 RepID=UPI0022B64478|nr:DUF6244 family protein [Micromonospora sp. WMMC250]MCZ7373286.1 DUF6244 family protein [Micromonospora sp. WMMC250]MCZ7373325.1 DUF6244 family protein [Micromonospora sp. WMMC250]MCZ7379936.1 DUF6244 family protein [Micromonospora sp. WMMC250]
MSAAELISRLLQAKAHLDQARELMRAAGSELHQARALIRAALQGAADHSTATMVDRSSQQLDGAGITVGQSADKVEEILTRVRGLGGLGN